MSWLLVERGDEREVNYSWFAGWVQQKMDVDV